MAGFLRYFRRNPALTAGLAIFLALVLFAGVGSLLVPSAKAYPLAVKASQPPSREYPFGTDAQGRDLLAMVIRGTYLTSRIGFIAGSIGLGIGTVLGFLSAYYGGVLDTIIRWVVDVLLTVPGLLVLIVISATIKRGISVMGMSLIVSCLAWMGPTRTIRAQVLSLRERAFVRVAKLSGEGDLRIIFEELMPNLLPFLAASFVGAVTGAVFASMGLEALGLGSLREPTLGTAIYFAMFYSAFVSGMWWWFIAPVSIIVLLFVSLFLISVGLDELANPRTRRAA